MGVENVSTNEALFRAFVCILAPLGDYKMNRGRPVSYFSLTFSMVYLYKKSTLIF